MKKRPEETMKLILEKTINSWDEAIPLGNGICGALIWGHPRELRISLDRGDIWDNTSGGETDKEEFTYPMLVKLAKDGDMNEIRRIFEDMSFRTLPTKLPAGKIIFDFGRDDNVRCELDLQRAEAEIAIGDEIHIRSFLHAGKKVGMIKIDQPKKTFSFYIENPQYGVEGEDVSGEEMNGFLYQPSLKRLVYPAPQIVVEEELKYFTQTVGQDFTYGIFAMEKEINGSVEIAYTIATQNDGENWQECAIKEVEQALESGYAAQFQSHEKWWEQYWDKSSIELPDKFFEKNWYLTQYFLACCSRKGGYPMPLQGVWTADDGALPPWKGDYHFDLNVQMSYSSYLKANHVEEGEALTDYLWSLVEQGRDFSETFYHAKGLCLPSTMSLTGEPIGGWAMYAFSPTNQLWTCLLLDRHYRYIGDRKLLKEKVYPYLAEVGMLIRGLLEEREGMYYLPISSSPEIHDNTHAAFLTPNSNYDLGLMRYLFGTLGELSERLENGEEKEWKAVLEKLPELAVNSDGVLMISPDEELKISHRHMSHAMSIYPLRMLPYDDQESRRIIDATVLELERLGTGSWVGYSFPWMAEFYAVQKNGNGAAGRLEVFWKDYCSPNGFHLNGDYKRRGHSWIHYRPFTLEGNFGAADALQEMLLYDRGNELHLFPAIPNEWLDGKTAFKKFRTENGLLVSATLENGIVTSLMLEPEFAQKVVLKIDEKIAPLMEKMNIQEENGKVELVLCKKDQYAYKL